ncbi:MAG: nucleotide pyrophosphohydrolase, partial [Bacilli bacterium]
MNKKVMEKILDFRNERDWEQYHSGENLAKSLIIEAAELLELYQWGNEVENIERLKEELADVMI